MKPLGGVGGAAEDGGCGRVHDLDLSGRIQHHDPFADRVHDRAELLLAVLEGQLAVLGLRDVRVNADHTSVRHPRLADPEPLPAAQPELLRPAAGSMLGELPLDPLLQLVALGSDVLARDVLDEVPVGRAQHHPVSRGAEQLAEAPVAEHESVIGIPEGEALVDGFGRQDESLTIQADGFQALLEPVDHAVERLPDPRDLVPAVQRGTHGEIACADLIGHRREPRQPTGQDVAHRGHRPRRSGSSRRWRRRSPVDRPHGRPAGGSRSRNERAASPDDIRRCPPATVDRRADS